MTVAGAAWAAGAGRFRVWGRAALGRRVLCRARDVCALDRLEGRQGVFVFVGVGSGGVADEPGSVPRGRFLRVPKGHSRGELREDLVRRRDVRRVSRRGAALARTSRPRFRAAPPG